MICECGADLPTRKYNLHRRTCPVFRQVIIKEVQRIAAELGRPPGIPFYRRLKGPNMPGPDLVRSIFGDWAKVLVEAGFELSERHQPRPAPHERSRTEKNQRYKYYWESEEDYRK